MYYFGTSLTSAGHFFWILHEDRMENKALSFPDGRAGKWKDMPFDPEEMPKHNGRSIPFGEVQYYRINGFTICAISGSCKDGRNGSKSVFFTDEKLKYSELVEKIMSIPIAKKMIEQMPFEVKWGLAVNPKPEGL